MDKFYLKGQGAMEFIILLSFLVFIFIVVLGIVSNEISYINKKKEIIIGEDIVTKVQKEINLAARVLDGYSREFMLPQRLDKRDYNISIVGNEVVVTLGKQNFWRVIPPVVGNIKNKEKNIINKTNGVIYLN